VVVVVVGVVANTVELAAIATVEMMVPGPAMMVQIWCLRADPLLPLYKTLL
jgi:hypothetical protein